MKKIFVGGYGGTGSRVFQGILAKAGYYLGHHNEYYDWLVEGGPYIPYVATEAYHSGNVTPLLQLVENTVVGHDSWSLKHGHLMFLFHELKQAYPDALCVLTVRHPLDTITNAYTMHHSHGGWPLATSLENKFNFYAEAHDRALRNTDFVFRLEDAVYHPGWMVTAVLRLAGLDVPNDLTPFTRDIIVPESIGRGSQYYQQFRNHPIVQRLGYGNVS